MRRGLTGEYVVVSTAGGETVRAFVPAPLPPGPPLSIDGGLRARLDDALLALGRLDSVSTLLPDTQLFLYAYVRKEAVLSSQIEGMQSSLSDLLLFELEEAPRVPIDDVMEVSNYVAALEHGLARVQGGFPLSNRLFCEMHGILLSRGRGADKQPGEFRRSQNWIGGTRPGNAQFVPPPPDRVPECMASLERFVNDEPRTAERLVKAAMAHVQFETIHPFLDGNGRVGRLLVTLLLCVDGMLREPLLYLSLFLKEHRQDYYALLDRVRTQGEWEAWIEFFAEGVRATADEAVDNAKTLARIFRDDRAAIQSLGRSAGSALRVHEVLRKRPLGSIASLARQAGLSVPTTTSALRGLEKLGIVREITGRARSRLYSYHAYLTRLSEGTTPFRA
ncbi:MAG: Fic family protein [Pseudomonadota bacterium]